MPSFPQAADFPGAFRAFGLEPEGDSIYPFNPVFRVRWEGRDAVLKCTQSSANAARLDHWTRALGERGVRIVAPLAPAREAHDATWTLYPFIPGRPYTATLDDIRGAGKLLGQMHRSQTTFLVPFHWPDNTPESVQEDITALHSLAEQGHLAPAATERLIAWEHAFNTDVYAPLREADLPRVDASLDFKGNNLIYDPAGQPTLIDPDNGEALPRVFDLAVAALLFHLDLPAPGRPFTPEEWQVFARAYQHVSPLTDTERELWPLALRYILQEWGVWHLSSDDEGWATPGQREFLHALAIVNLGNYAL